MLPPQCLLSQLLFSPLCPRTLPPQLHQHCNFRHHSGKKSNLFCIKDNSVNKKPICNLDQLSDLIYSTNPKRVAENCECEEAAGGKAGMGDRNSQAVLAAEVPLLITRAASVPLVWHRYQREFPCTA